MINSECGNVWGYHGSAGDVDFTWDYHIMIDAFRRYPKCAGWLYTEHHDVINEWNGYVHYDRSPKIDGLDDLVPGMTVADFQSLYYICPEKYLYTVNKPGEWVDLSFYGSFMTDRNPGTATSRHSASRRASRQPPRVHVCSRSSPPRSRHSSGPSCRPWCMTV